MKLSVLLSEEVAGELLRDGVPAGTIENDNTGNSSSS